MSVKADAAFTQDVRIPALSFKVLAALFDALKRVPFHPVFYHETILFLEQPP